jgi:diguanylate cyclase (GGDEF)-like protein
MLERPRFALPKDAAQAAQLEARLLAEQAGRARAVLLFLAPTLFIIWRILAEPLAASAWVRAAFWLTVALGAARWGVLAYVARAAPGPGVVRRGRRLAFSTSLAMGLAFAGLNLAALPHLDLVELALLTIIASGVNAVALASLAAVSLPGYFVYMVPNFLSLAYAGAHAASAEMAFYLPLLIVIYAFSLSAMAFWMHAHLRGVILLNLELRESALRDPLTGLRNRRFLTEFLDPESERVLRSWIGAGHHAGPPESLGFFFLDVDHFKSINDRHCHDGGDAILRQLADRLRVTTRASDLLLRWGGEEFVVVARGLERVEVRPLAERLRQRVSALPFRLPDGGSLRVTCSVGYCLFPFETRRPLLVPASQVLTIADRALSVAKRLGRDNATGIAAAADGTAGEEELRRALDEDVLAAAARGLVLLETGGPRAAALAAVVAGAEA